MTKHHIHPPTDHVPSRCPVCGRGDCPEPDPRGGAPWLLLIVTLIAVPLLVGWGLWELAHGGLEVLVRGLGGMVP